MKRFYECPTVTMIPLNQEDLIRTSMNASDSTPEIGQEDIFIDFSEQ